MRPVSPHVLWPAAMTGVLAARYAADSLRHRRERGHGYELRGERLDVGSPDFMRAAEALTGAPISEGNDLELCVNGDEIFPAFLDVIRGAERTLNLLTYVYWRGDIADEVCEAVCERARAGVEVNVLLDAVGTAKMRPELLSRMQDAGATVCRFRPPKPYAVRRLNYRTHRKLLIADGRVGMTGGVGIADEWTGNAQDPDHWRDTHVLVRGPVVRGMQGAFAENWLEATGDVLVGDGYLPPLEPLDGGGPMQLVRSSARVGDTNAEALTFLALASARRSIDLTSAYFAPRPAFTEALADACERGVRVRILVPGQHGDKQIVRVAGRAAYDALLAAGAEIYEYAPTMLHAKVLTIDEAWSSIGSINFDNRSFQLQDEATLAVQSRKVAARLTDCFAVDVERAERIEPHRWRRRAPTLRLREAATAVVRREL